MAKFSKPLQFSETRSGLAALNQANQEAELKDLSKQIEKLGGSAVERSSLGRDGVERRDLGETIKATSQALNRLKTEQRYTDGYGKDWHGMRIGKKTGPCRSLKKLPSNNISHCLMKATKMRLSATMQVVSVRG